MDRLDITAIRRALGPTLAARISSPIGASTPSPRAPIEAPGGRSAAVAAILREGERGLEVLFIQRAEREGDPWSGHMAFPGGRRELHDADLLATAIRETEEEIGVDLLRAAELVGVLDDQEATGRSTQEPLPTRPFVFELTGAPRLTLNREVTEVLWAPVEPLWRGERRTSIDITYKSTPYTLPGWDVEGRIVWGLTYRMMSTLLEKLKP